MKTAFFYHEDCLDGFGAAWAAWMLFGEDGIYVPVSYRDAENTQFFDYQGPGKTGTDIYFLDFCPKKKVLEHLLDQNYNVTVLDHHVTAKPEVQDVKGKGGFHAEIRGRSGAVMAWQHFHPLSSVPRLLLLIEDRDLWKWELQDTERSTEALRVLPMDFDTWSAHMGSSLAGLLEWGDILLKKKEQVIKQVMQRVANGTVGGHTVPMVNTDSYPSEVGNRMCEEFEGPFSATYYHLADGQVKWSLRSIGDFDVSEVARKYGGGGHKNAAGFVVP